MSNYLIEIKKEYGDRVILLPIAADTNVESLDVIKKIYGLDKTPIIFVNEKYKIDNLDSLSSIRNALVK